MNQRRKSLEHMTFHLDIPRDLKEKKTNRPPPAPNLLAIFESETTEGGKLLQYFERFSARHTNHTMHNILLLHCICSLHNGHIRIISRNIIPTLYNNGTQNRRPHPMR